MLTVARDDQGGIGRNLLRLVSEHLNVVRVGTEVAELGEGRSRDGRETSWSRACSARGRR